MTISLVSMFRTAILTQSVSFQAPMVMAQLANSLGKNGVMVPGIPYREQVGEAAPLMLTLAFSQSLI
jgi:hypothetical protein